MNKNNKKEIRKFAEQLVPIYELFNWRWNDKPESPTVNEIEKEILSLMDMGSGTSSGGLSVYKNECNQWEISWILEKIIYLSN